MPRDSPQPGNLRDLTRVSQLMNYSQGTLFTEDLSRDLMQSRVGRAIIKLASLRSKTQQVDFGRLFSSIDDLEEALQVDSV
jgi:hypothetical protein